MYRALPQSPSATAPSRKEPLVCANIALSAFAVPRDSSLTLKNDNVGRRFASRSITKLLSFGADRRDAGPYKLALHCALIFRKANIENVSKSYIYSERRHQGTALQSQSDNVRKTPIRLPCVKGGGIFARK